MATPMNHAAYLVDKSGKPLEIKEAPYNKPGPNQIVVRPSAIAINPVDAGIQKMGSIAFTYLKYPCIIGSDVAGEVVEVGTGGGASHLFAVGDRVVGDAVGMDPHVNSTAEGAFQEYVVLRTNLASKIPDDITYQQACVLPLALSTAACGLYQKDYLALEHPTPKPKATGKTLLIWGGSTSVGSNAIQLARASGYEVFTTASPKNFDYVKGLGAARAFDYRDKDVVSKITQAFREGNAQCAGALAIGSTSLEPCIDIVSAVGQGRKFVAQASMPFEPTDVPKGLGLVNMMLKFMWWNVSIFFRKRYRGVNSKFIWGGDLMGNEVGAAVYTDFLGEALAQGSYKPAPEPMVVGKGLEKLQEALEVIRKGVSARKVVVSM